jgi:hypothetical protein
MLKLPVDEALVDRLYTDRIANSTDGNCTDLEGLKALISEMVGETA